MEQSFSTLGVIILGAGASSRMGRPKLLLPWHGTTVIGQIIGQWRELGARQITVVHRRDDSALLAELRVQAVPPSHWIENPHPERGMFSSIQCAAHWNGWKPETAVYAIVLGDQPHLRTDLLRSLLSFQAEHPDAACQPEFEGHARHPVLLPRRIFEKLRQTETETLNDFLKQFARSSVQCKINDPSLSLDLDTPEDYKEAVNRFL